jgi:hypothetical protein
LFVTFTSGQNQGNNIMVRLGQLNPQAWDEAVDDIITKNTHQHQHPLNTESTMTTTGTGEDHKHHAIIDENDISVDWRVGAAAKRLDREMFEEYGYFKDFILHPRTQYYKNLIESNVSTKMLHLQWGEPLIPLVGAIILISMIGNRLGRNLTMLLTALIFNVNPMYVVLIMICSWKWSKQGPPKQYLDARSKKLLNSSANHASMSTKIDVDELIAKAHEFDHVLVGGGINILMAAAILSTRGRKCCVLNYTSAEVHPKGAPTPVAIKDYSIGRIHRYQVNGR